MTGWLSLLVNSLLGTFVNLGYFNKIAISARVPIFLLFCQVSNTHDYVWIKQVENFLGPGILSWLILPGNKQLLGRLIPLMTPVNPPVWSQCSLASVQMTVPVVDHTRRLSKRCYWESWTNRCYWESWTLEQLQFTFNTKLSQQDCCYNVARQKFDHYRGNKEAICQSSWGKFTPGN